MPSVELSKQDAQTLAKNLSRLVGANFAVASAQDLAAVVSRIGQLTADTESVDPLLYGLTLSPDEIQATASGFRFAANHFLAFAIDQVKAGKKPTLP